LFDPRGRQVAVGTKDRLAHLVDVLLGVELVEDLDGVGEALVDDVPQPGGAIAKGDLTRGERKAGTAPGLLGGFGQSRVAERIIDLHQLPGQRPKVPVLIQLRLSRFYGRSNRNDLRPCLAVQPPGQRPTRPMPRIVRVGTVAVRLATPTKPTDELARPEVAQVADRLLQLPSSLQQRLCVVLGSLHENLT
jgi:hypothetical protein